MADPNPLVAGVFTSWDDPALRALDAFEKKDNAGGKKNNKNKEGH
jgi:hypothetical protein